MRYLLDAILQLKWYLIMTISASFIGAGTLLVTVRKMTWKKQSIKLGGLFFDMNDRAAVALGAGWLRLWLVFYMLFFSVQMNLVYISVFALLLIIQCTALPGARVLLFQLFNNALIAGSVFTVNILVSYVRDVELDWQVITVAGLLALFIIMYNLYFFVRDISIFSEEGWKSVHDRF